MTATTATVLADFAALNTAADQHDDRGLDVVDRYSTAILTHLSAGRPERAAALIADAHTDLAAL